MQLLKDRIIAEKLPDGNESKTGLFIGHDLLQANRAKVVMIGPKVKHLKIGDVIKYYPLTGTELYYKDKECLVLEESQHIDRVL